MRQQNKITQLPVKQAVDCAIGGNIRRYRNARLLTAEGLGMRMTPPMSDCGVTKMERGEARIYAGHLFDIARVLNIPLSCLMEGIEETQLGDDIGAQPLSRAELRMLRDLAAMKDAQPEEQAEHILKCFETLAKALGEKMSTRVGA